jgi:uncharacterized protein (TIGR02996 family)
MTNSDEQAFLKAILAAPDDDTPRLVFADWLDERGEGDDAARAALIRAQCRLERLPLGSKERNKLQREAKAILKKHGDRWAKALHEAVDVRQCEFRRGFLEHVAMSATTFAQNAKKIFDAVPTIRSACFIEASNEMARVAKCKYLARLAALDIHELCHCGFCPIHNDLRALFNTKHAASLTELNVAGDRMDWEGAERLAKSAALAKLTTLDVSNNPLGDDGVAALGKSKHLTQLVTLNLSACSFTGAGLEELGNFKNLTALRNLILRTNDITAMMLQPFVVSPLFAQLTSLDLSGNPFANAGAQVLAAAPKTAALETLTVKRCRVSGKGLALLKRRFGKGLVK